MKTIHTQLLNQHALIQRDKAPYELGNLQY